MLMRPEYLSQKLDWPLATKDGGTLRTILDVRAYMLRLSKDGERSAQWQRATQLLLEHADVAALSRQVELAACSATRFSREKSAAEMTHLSSED
jgi:hypothetical protein